MSGCWVDWVRLVQSAPADAAADAAVAAVAVDVVASGSYIARSVADCCPAS